MTDSIPMLPGLSPVCGKRVVAKFDGGRLSSDGGLLALREVEARLGVAERWRRASPIGAHRGRSPMVRRRSFAFAC
jgi:hypothetical protein